MAEQKKKKKKRIPVLYFLVFGIGIAVLLYPAASNCYNMMHQSTASSEYAENLAAMDNEEIRRMWEEAKTYNDTLYRAQLGEEPAEGILERYDRILRVTENGMMGYIEIDKLSVCLPVYHGTSSEVLQKGAGHLEWSSFPVGGENTHTVITGHTGLPSTRLFTDLHKLTEGDKFILRIVGEVETYEVDLIETVLPYEVDSLIIEKGKDLCTLVTCTPYGINTHRLLVHAHRIENAASEEAGNPGSKMQNNVRESLLLVLATAAGLIVLMILVVVMVKPKNRDKESAKEENSEREKII